MSSYIKAITASLLFIIIYISGAPAACAQTAHSGAQVVARVYISGKSGVTSLNDTISYDSQLLELQSCNMSYSMSAVNDTEPGKLTFAVIFDAVSGADFTDKTEVFTATFAAKADINDLKGAVKNIVSEFIDADLKKIDSSYVTLELEVTGSGAAGTGGDDSQSQAQNQNFGQSEAVQSGGSSHIVEYYDSSSRKPQTASAGSKQSAESGSGETKSVAASSDSKAESANGSGAVSSQSTEESKTDGTASQSILPADGENGFDAEKTVQSNEEKLTAATADTPEIIEKRYTNAFIIGAIVLALALAGLIFIVINARRRGAHGAK